MDTFIFLHGANQGGWIWAKTTRFMESYPIFTPTFTGMGERKHLLTESLTLQTHLDDLSNLIFYENLENVFLVGYSYAGLILPAIYDMFPEKIKKLIFLDSFIPQQGKTGLAVVEQKYQDKWNQAAQEDGNGWEMHASAALLDVWGVKDEQLKLMLLPKLTSFSLNFLKTPIYFSQQFTSANKVYIRCSNISYFNKIMMPFYEQAQNQQWPCYQLAASHLPMQTHPKELAELLIQIATKE